MTREEAIRQIENRWSIMDYGESEALGEALDMAIEALQTEGEKGEWIFNTDENNGKSWNICSVCGYSIFHTTNFCPNCGARMKGGAE